MSDSFKKLWGKASEPSTHAPAERLTLEGVRETVRRLGEKWPKHKGDLDAVQNWLSTTKDQMNKMSNRLERLKNWIGLYNAASEAAQATISFESWLSVTLPGKAEVDWEVLAYEANIHLRPIQNSHAHCAMSFEKDTASFIAMEAEILHAIGNFKREIERIEACLSQMREACEDARCREAFKQIQSNATNMTRCSVELCQRLYHAIGNLVNALDRPIKEL